jgi:3-dehydroquinate dehydratase / shikimate dehydrogenase
MTQICVPLIEERTAGIIDRMVELSDQADLFEVRADYVRDLDLLMILRARSKPLLLTCRCVSEGGRFPDDDPRRRLILLEAVKRGYDYVDVEYRSQMHDVMVEKAGSGLIVSYHDLDGTPDNLSALYDRMCAAGADIVKIVTTPKSIADVARLMAFAARTSREGGPPLLALAMGPLGTLTRLLAGRYEAPFTFASAAQGAESAPGQIPLKATAELYRARSVTRKTRVYGILGRGISHSLSPVIHNHAFQDRGLDAVYVPLEAEALAPFMQSLPVLELSGFSVTAPYKVEMLPYLQEVDELAALCGSANTVVVREGALQGSSTDGVGVLVPLKKRIDVKGKNVVIVGAGGAARATAFALHRKGAFVTVLARDPEKAAALADAVGCGFGELASIANQAWDVLINATPIGGVTTVHETPVPPELHRRGAVVFDMVYVPQETRLLREARAAGCRTIGGLEMLLAQAEGQFEAWTGTPAPAEVMREALLGYLEGSDDQEPDDKQAAEP